VSLIVEWMIGNLVLSLLGVRLAITYARSRSLLDQPGRRRSHRIPTPRGGGIGIVIAMAACLAVMGWHLAATWLFAALACMVLVALVGWWDDHHALPALPRLVAHLAASAGFSVVLLGTDLPMWWLLLLVPAGAWSINLHNFMDGIDGLLAQQTLFVALGLAVLATSAHVLPLAVASAALATAALGFWYFNRPPARIFMGDVGSGAVGFLIFAFSAALWRLDHALVWPSLILSSAFVVDATLTLLTRISRGRRWYGAHREHLYQWLARRQRSHASVDGGYMLWNVLIAAPLAWLALSHLRWALPITIIVYVLAATAWFALKHRCLQRHPAKDRHVAA
jgi:UDP-N-acetylmuramyl pentapeptide phosphotransferase/UDP-N-acetylglucosamine-1-phosphate transferase